MFCDKRRVDQTLLTVDGKRNGNNTGGEVFALVKFTDESYGITRGGNVIEGLYFLASHLDECTRHLLRLAQIDDHNEGDDHRPR